MNKSKQYRYLFAHACFGCQKSFKRVCQDKDIKRCPHCGKDCILLSRNFKAPRMGDKAQWGKVEFLVNQGFRFFSHPLGSDGCHVPLDTMEQAKEFISNYRKEHQEAPTPLTSRASKRQQARRAARQERQNRIKKAEYRKVRGI
jgi:hypothetical protein